MLALRARARVTRRHTARVEHVRKGWLVDPHLGSSELRIMLTFVFFLYFYLNLFHWYDINAKIFGECEIAS